MLPGSVVLASLVTVHSPKLCSATSVLSPQVHSCQWLVSLFFQPMLVAVSVTKHRNFKRFLESADGAAARLAAGFCRACFFSHRPLAEAVLRYIGLVAAGAFVPVARLVILPVGAVAVSARISTGISSVSSNPQTEQLCVLLPGSVCACFFSHRPLAEAVRSHIGLVAAGTFVPAVRAVLAPLVAIGMLMRRC